MSGLTTSRRKPEEEELDQKQAELASLEAELVQKELDLATLRGELRAFEGEYFQVIGKLYVELDTILAQIADLLARRFREARAAQASAESARAQAEHSASEFEAQGGSACRFEAPPELKKLYREVARQLHPDFSADEKLRRERERLMTEANLAYQRGDEARLRALLSQWEASPDTVEGEGVAATLLRVIRKTSQVRARLSEIEEEMHELTRSDICQLHRRLEQAGESRETLLAELREDLDRQIEQAGRRLTNLQRN